MSGAIAVVIPAYRAAWCIGDAVASALAQPDVAEVLVVDDASGDDTLAAAQSADDGSGRLILLQQEVNQGPSAARNRAIAQSSAPLIALLDADDRFLQGRFASLRAIREDWDFVADEILFASDAASLETAPTPDTTISPRVRQIDLVEFADRNISRRGAHRSELGFLKPVMKRAFLARHGLTYDENLRLGEDFVLYARALFEGACFLLADSCGYGAIERPGSLSGKHSAEDLAALAQASRALAASLPPGEERAMMARHAAALEVKVSHRRFLDRKREQGLLTALARAVAAPARFAEVSWNIALDKFSPQAPLPLPRRLFSDEEFERA